MKTQLCRLKRGALACLGAAALFGSATAKADENVFEAIPIGVEAYIYGYPLVTMEMTRRVMTNVEKPEGTHAPTNQLVRMRTYPNAAFRDVTTPNADTLYVMAWIDVGKEPWVLSLPDFGSRYCLFPMLDAWTNVFASPGTRTTGDRAQTCAITGPGWKGTLPTGVKQYVSPTAIVWLIGRIYCTGTPEDYRAVHQLEDAITLVPLSAYGKSYTPPPGKVDASVDMNTAVREQVNSLSAYDFFTLLAQLMKDNPPAPADAPIVDKMAKIGIVPGQPFDTSQLSNEAREAFDWVPKMGQERISLWMKEAIPAGKMKWQNGWVYSTDVGVYGTDYLQRALITVVGLGANTPQDAVYPMSMGPGVFSSYHGAKKYVMHFDKGELPPVRGFWSLTMYDAQHFFVENPLNRYSISPRQDLKSNPDGSIDLYIQHESPGPDKESNWLPAPADKFNLVLRMYWPKKQPPSLLDGTWKIPPVTVVE